MSDSQPVMVYKDIIKVLPHRYPFLLVDKVISLTKGSKEPNRAGRKIHAVKNVTINEPFFMGHFPHRPVMPGVLIIEAMAQAAALCCYRPEDKKQDVAMCSIKESKFRIPVQPGDVLDMHVECLRDRGQMIFFKGQTFIKGELAAETEFMAKMFDMVDGELA